MLVTMVICLYFGYHGYWIITNLDSYDCLFHNMTIFLRLLIMQPENLFKILGHPVCSYVASKKISRKKIFVVFMDFAEILKYIF